MIFFLSTLFAPVPRVWYHETRSVVLSLPCQPAHLICLVVLTHSRLLGHATANCVPMAFGAKSLPVVFRVVRITGASYLDHQGPMIDVCLSFFPTSIIINIIDSIYLWACSMRDDNNIESIGGRYYSSASCCCCCSKKNQNAPRSSQHPPVTGGKMSKTFRWDHRLQIQ